MTLRSLHLKLLLSLSLAMPSMLWAKAPGACDLSLTPVQLETKFGTITINTPEALIYLRDQQQIAEGLKLKGAARKEFLKKYFQQRPVTRMQVGATFLNYATAIWMAMQIKAGMTADPESALRAVALLPPTLLASDFISGVFHKFLDSYGSEASPLWGEAARSFRIHHEFPGNLNELSYIDNISPFGKLMIPFYLLGAWSTQYVSPDAATSILLTLLLFTNGSEIHRQAHLPEPHWLAAPIQKIRLILSKRKHLEHHKDDHNSDFGIINGWSNSATGRLAGVIDKIYWKARKKMPHNWVQHPESIPDKVISDLADDLELIPQELFVTAAMDPKSSDERVDELLRLWVEKHPANEVINDTEGENAPSN